MYVATKRTFVPLDIADAVFSIPPLKFATANAAPIVIAYPFDEAIGHARAGSDVISCSHTGIAAFAEAEMLIMAMLPDLTQYVFALSIVSLLLNDEDGNAIVSFAVEC